MRNEVRKKNVTMKNLLSFLLPILFVCSIHAQGLEIYGLQTDQPFDPNNPTASSVQLALLNLNSGNFMPLTTLANSQSIAYGSKSYDHGNRRFIFWGIDDFNVRQFYTVPVDTGGTPVVSQMQNNVLFGTGTPIQLEYDLQADTTYGIMYSSSLSKNFFSTIDLQSGIIDTVKELPGVEGIVNLTSTYNSNHHRYIFQGIDNANRRLYTVDPLTGNILDQPILNQEYAFVGLEYDLNTDQLFGLYTEDDTSVAIDPMSQQPYRKSYLVEIDTLTGTHTLVSSTPLIEGYQSGFLLGSNDFDQLSRTFVFVGTTDTTGLQIYLVNAATGNITATIPYSNNVQFLQVDNQAFARQAYGEADSSGGTDAIEVREDITVSIYPNPATEEISIEVGERTHVIQLSLTSMEGKVLWKRELGMLENKLTIQLDDLPAGLYGLTARSDKGLHWVRKIVKQ